MGKECEDCKQWRVAFKDLSRKYRDAAGLLGIAPPFPKSPWVSVNDELPMDGRLVLTTIAGYNVIRSGRFDPRDGWLLYENPEFMNGKVDFWMDAPELPDAKKPKNRRPPAR